jgi:hypothetical protein
MTRPTSQPHAPKIIWASELGRARVCEQRLVFEARFGERETVAQRVRQAEGSSIHVELHRQACLINPNVETSSPQPIPAAFATPRRCWRSACADVIALITAVLVRNRTLVTFCLKAWSYLKR